MTALEIYYKTQKPTSDVQEKAIDEFMGLPIKKKNIGLFHKLLDVLDRPGNATRALLVGKLGGLKGMIPFAQTFENLTGLDVAMNEDELVTGSEVIEKWFGKQKQRKGKLDPVDVLGFMVEVAAEPLWLVGIGGLTKAGKAARLAKSGIRAAKASGQLPKIKAMIEAAKAGKTIDATKLSKAFLTVYQSGGKPTLAKTWATQATKGQRALFKFAGKPIIKGAKPLGAVEKFGTAFKMGKTPLGQWTKELYAPTKRVLPAHKELHDIYVHFGRDLPHVERTKYFEKLKGLFQEGAAKNLSAEDMDKVVRKYVQRAYAGEGGERLIGLEIGKRQKRAAKEVGAIKYRITTTEKSIASLERKLQPRPKGMPKERPIQVFTTAEATQVIKQQGKTVKPNLYIGNVTRRMKKKFGEVFGVSPEEIHEFTEAGWKVKRTAVPLTGKEAQAYLEFLNDDIIRKLERNLVRTENQLAMLNADWGDVKELRKVLGLKSIPTPYVVKRAPKHQIKVISNVAERIKMATHPASLYPSKMSKQQVLDAVMRKVQQESKKAYVAGEKGRLTQQLGKLQKTKTRWEEVYAKGLKETPEGVVPVAKIQKVHRIITKRETQAKALFAEQPELAGKIKPIGKKYKELHEELIRGELAAGAPAKQITYPIGYASRRPTEAFREFLEANKHHPVVASFSRDLSARNPAQRMRNKVLGFMTDDEALDYFKKLGFKGKDVFEPGMAMPTMQRAAMSTRTVGAGRTVDEALKKFSKPDMPYWQGKGYTASAEHIMTEAGIRPEIAMKMRGRLVPQDVADALLNMHSLATSEESLAGFWKAWVGTQRYMKGAFTMPWPAYHGRNMFSNFVLNWINGVQNPQSYMEALAIQLGRGKAIRLATGQVLSPDDILKHADDWGILGRSVGMFAPEEIGGQAIIGTKGVVKRHFLGQGKIRQTGQKLGVAVENNARLAHFIDKLKKGYNFNDAAVSAKKVLFDYGDLSRVEKRFLRDRGVFFYTFMRKNLPLQMETLLKQPGKQAAWSHLAGGAPAMAKKEPMPDWWREQIVTRPLYTTKKGEEIRIAGLGVPMEEAFGSFAGPGHSMWEGARRIAARQFGRLSPPITATTEFVTGKDIFYNKPISKLGYAPTIPSKYLPGPAKKALGIRPITYEGRPTRYTMSPQAAWMLRKSPLARAWSSAAMLSREEEPLAIRASHFLTGFKPRMINPELQRQIGERRATKRYLEDQFQAGKVRRFERYYTPKEWPKDEKMEALLRSQ